MLALKDVSVGYKQGLFASHKKQILSEISFTLAEGESLGIVGKSGSGKTTIANAILGLAPCRGGISIDGKPRAAYSRKALARKVQLVTQDPQTSFDPDRTVAQSLKEVLKIHRLLPADAALEEVVNPLLADVGLAGARLDKPPRRYSGGELQRLSVLRALLPSPGILIFDEADSMLDTELRLKLFDMLGALRQKRRLSYIYITHDIRALPHLVDRVLVLAGGQGGRAGPGDVAAAITKCVRSTAAGIYRCGTLRPGSLRLEKIPRQKGR